MTSPNYPQLAASFANLRTQLLNLSNRFKDTGPGDSNIVAITTPGPYTVPIPVGVTHVDRVVISGGGEVAAEVRAPPEEGEAEEQTPP